MMADMGFPVEDDLVNPAGGYVFSFPQKSPKTSKFRKDVSAIEQLEVWLMYKKHWTEHNPSVTIYVKEHEWMKVGSWVYDHFDDACGIAFLPSSDHSYKQAPFQEISKDEYEVWLGKMPKNVDWKLISEYEKEDTTTSSRELACTGDSCML